MTLLKSGHDVNAKDHFCLHSSNKHIVLYIEADQKHEKLMELDYSIKPLSKKYRQHRMKGEYTGSPTIAFFYFLFYF